MMELKAYLYCVEKNYNAAMDVTINGIDAPEKRYGKGLCINYGCRKLSRKILHHVEVIAFRTACFKGQNVLAIIKRGNRTVFILRLATWQDGSYVFGDVWIMKGMWGMSQLIRRMTI